MPAIASSRADEHHPERRRGVEAVADHHAVALLEDVERQRDARREHGVEGEQRDPHRRPA
jgi:hypothetical protein